MSERKICLYDSSIHKFSYSSFRMEFEHSMYGGKVIIVCEPDGEKIRVIEMLSESEAAMSYYTDDYGRSGELFTHKINQSFEELRVNDGWRIFGSGFNYTTKSNSVIFVCR